MIHSNRFHARTRALELFSQMRAAAIVATAVAVYLPGAAAADGVSQIAGPTVGSSEPTYFGTQHRLVVAEGGRSLTVHGLHGQGVQLAWRDPDGAWENATTGAVSNGTLLEGTETGDWPASIALARDSAGVEHAWAIFARISASKPFPLYLRRISDLASASGPTVGPLVELDSPGLGAYKPDVAFEQASSGEMRGAVLWSRKTGPTDHETVIGWLSDLDTDTPALHDKTVIISPGPGGNRWGTLVSSAAAMNAVVRPGNPNVKLFRHSAGSPLDIWADEPSGLSAGGYPSATVLDSGQILSVVESDLALNTVMVQRYSAAGAPQDPELTLEGYSMPTIATDGVNAWIVMIRQSDGAVVSRSYAPDSGWNPQDTVEVGVEAGGDYAYPNLARRTDGSLRFVFEGAGSSPVTSSVLASERSLPDPPPEPLADLALSLRDTPDPVRAGRTLKYVLKIKNLGEADARKVKLVSIPPRRFLSASPGCRQKKRSRVICSWRKIAAGTKKRLVIRVRPSAAHRRIEHRAWVSADTADPALANNEAVERTTVPP